MGTYYIPRNVKGEGRILFIFSTKALIFTAVGAGVGVLLYMLFSAIGIGVVGLVSLIVLSLLGFVIGTLKVPDTSAFEITKKTGGENIDDVIVRYIKFRMNKNKLYVYAEDKKEGEE